MNEIAKEVANIVHGSNQDLNVSTKLNALLENKTNEQIDAILDFYIQLSEDQKKAEESLNALNFIVQKGSNNKLSAYIYLKLAELTTDHERALKLVQDAVKMSHFDKHLMWEVSKFILGRDLFTEWTRGIFGFAADNEEKNAQIQVLCSIILDQRRTIAQLVDDRDAMQRDIYELTLKVAMLGVTTGHTISPEDEFLKYSKYYAQQVEERARLQITLQDKGGEAIDAGDVTNCIVYLHEGDLIATSHEKLGCVQIWDLSTRKLVSSFGKNLPTIWALEPIKGTDLIFVASPMEKGIWSYNWRSGERVDKLEYDSSISMYGHAKLKSFGVIKKYVIAAMQDGCLVIFDVSVKGGKVVKRFGKHDDQVYSCEILPRGRIAIGDRGHVTIWNMHTEQRENVFMAHKGKITSLVLLDDEVLLSGSDAGMIKIWDLKTRCCLKILFAHSSQINQIVMLGANLFASASDDKSCKLWSLDQGEVTYLFEHKKPVLGLCYFNRRLITASADHTMKVITCEYAKGITSEMIPPSIIVEEK
jgi:WD40 repeat protein